MMKIMTEIVKTIISMFHNDGYTQQWRDRYCRPQNKKDIS